MLITSVELVVPPEVAANLPPDEPDESVTDTPPAGAFTAVPELFSSWTVIGPRVALVEAVPENAVDVIASFVAVTVKFVPEFAELVPSDTTTGWAPLATAGMVNVTVEEPFVPAVPPPVIVAEAPPTVTVRAPEAANPAALIVALDPTMPLVGDKPVAETFTVKFVPKFAVVFVPSVAATV